MFLSRQRHFFVKLPPFAQKMKIEKFDTSPPDRWRARTKIIGLHHLKLLWEVPPEVKYSSRMGDLPPPNNMQTSILRVTLKDKQYKLESILKKE